jgi:hypothetical protein
LKDKNIAAKHDIKFLKGLAAATNCKNKTCADNYAKGFPPRDGCVFMHPKPKKKAFVAKIESIPPTANPFDALVEMLASPESIGDVGQVKDEDIKRGLSSVGVVKFNGGNFSNCFKVRDRLIFGKHPGTLINEGTVVTFEIGDKVITLPTSEFHGSVQHEKVKMLTSDNLASIWSYECKEITDVKIPNFVWAHEIPVVGSAVVIISQWSKPTPKPHTAFGKVTSFTEKGQNDRPRLLLHSCATDYGNCFSPIVLNNNPNKVVGVHAGGDVSASAQANISYASVNFL